jgi:carboxymethylenebutenolidase
MFEQEIIVTTKHGRMPAFVACPDGAGPFAPVIFYMDAPGTREELRNMARRIAKQGYVCLLPDMYYRLGTIRFDIPRRDDAMSGVIKAAMNSLTNALVTDDTGAMLAWFDAQDKVRPGPAGCVGHCMSGCYITTVAARFPHRIKAAASVLRLRRARSIGAAACDPGSARRPGQDRRGEHRDGFPRHASRFLLCRARGL